jgi:hypothetical protein
MGLHPPKTRRLQHALYPLFVNGAGKVVQWCPVFGGLLQKWRSVSGMGWQAEGNVEDVAEFTRYNSKIEESWRARRPDQG